MLQVVFGVGSCKRVRVGTQAPRVFWSSRVTLTRSTLAIRKQVDDLQEEEAEEGRASGGTMGVCQGDSWWDCQAVMV